MANTYIIDPPGPFATEKEWRNFLEEMRRIEDQDNERVKEAIREAERALEELDNPLSPQ